MMGCNKLGMHIHGMKPGIIQAVELLRPRTITMMDPTAREIRDVYAVADPVIVVRKYEDGRSFMQTDPRLWAEEYYRMVGDAVSDRLVAMGFNEPFGHDRRDLVDPFDEWGRAFIQRCRELGPMDGGALAMATGNWTGAANRYRITDDFPGTCDIAKWFLLHEYCWPTLQVGVPWYTLRYRAWTEDLEATGKEDFFFIVSEAGLTQAVIPGRDDVGWRSGGPEGVTEDSYISTIDWYNARLCEDWRVLGCCLYDWAGKWYNWGTFEQLGLEDRIFQIQAPEMPEPPEPPNGGNDVRIPDSVKIYDFEHGPHADDPTVSREWLRSIFGDCIDVHPVDEIHTLQPGDSYYQLQWINCKAGSTSVIIEVKDVNGDPVIGETVIFGWPNADPHGYADKGWNWTANGAAGDTEPPDGHVGPSMSKDSYYSPDQGECGAHFIWVWDLPSQMVDGVGMLPFHDLVPGANHLHTEYGFRAAVYGEEEPPEPPVNGELLGVVKEIHGEVKGTRLLVAEIRDFLTGREPPEPPEPEEVFHAEYFDNPNLEGEPVLTRDERVIDHFWGEGSPGPPVPVDYFSARWRGGFTFGAGDYMFHALVDDGFRLWLDGVLVMDAWKPQAPTRYDATATLSAGGHTVRAEYYEAAGGATCKVWWEKL